MMTSKRPSVTEKSENPVPYMDGIEIKSNQKDGLFLFYGYTFIYCTGQGEQNKICIFDDEITEQARQYADDNCPDFAVLDGLSRADRRDYTSKEKVEYWSKLFHMYIWHYLRKNNTVEYMKQ